jgi:uncharacterized cupredoxin-like copper-binding protein
MHRSTATLAAIVGLAGAVAGCGSDSSTSSSSAAADAAGDGQTATQSQASVSAPDATQVTGGRTTVAMTEFKFQPSALTTSAGKLRVSAVNKGSAEHEFVLIKTDKAPDALPVKGGTASEAGAVGEISEQKAGRGDSHTFTLKPGRYVYICNVPGHYQGGMRGTLTVK